MIATKILGITAALSKRKALKIGLLAAEIVVLALFYKNQNKKELEKLDSTE